jgi:1-deoxy-D-xylulose-5-phosphate reductoisomerase
VATSARRVLILGSTGSIGGQCLDVFRRLITAGERLEIVGLVAGHNAARLGEQIVEFTPEVIGVAEAQVVDALPPLPTRPEIHLGASGILEAIERCDADLVINALVGAMGLPPTLAALDRGATVALANKESLVVGGELIRERRLRGQGTIVPIDSELNAVWQCLAAGRREDLRRIVLTASGGPLLRVPLTELAAATPADVLAHPAWSMGQRITVDSATMANKALEVIETHFLFDVPYESIDAVVHPQAAVHGLVEFLDGAWIAHLAPTDMRHPIAHAIAGGRRVEVGLPRLSPTDLHELSFLALDEERFPAFAAILEAARFGATARAVANAADEVLVERFLDGSLGYAGIAAGLKATVADWIAMHPQDAEADVDLKGLQTADRWARAAAMSYGETP